MRIGDTVHYVSSTVRGVPTCHVAIITKVERQEETGLDYDRAYLTVLRPDSTPASLRSAKHAADELGSFHLPGEGWCES